MITSSPERRVKFADLPPAHQQMINLALAGVKTGARLATGRPVIRTRGHRAACLRICSGRVRILGHLTSVQPPCDQWRQTSQRCAACGCFGRWKAFLAASDCPLGKWPSLTSHPG